MQQASKKAAEQSKRKLDNTLNKIEKVRACGVCTGMRVQASAAWCASRGFQSCRSLRTEKRSVLKDCLRVNLRMPHNISVMCSERVHFVQSEPE